MRHSNQLLAISLLTLLFAGGAHAFDHQGHRGARGLAPENTMAGFDRALAVGVNTLELDVVVSADGVPMVHHDLTLNPDLTRDASGRWLDDANQPLRQLSAAQLASYDVGRLRPGTPYARTYPDQQPADGQRISTLAAVFARYKAVDVRFNVEIKMNPTLPQHTPEAVEFAQAVLAVIDAHQMRPRVTVQSFDWRPVQAMQRLAPDVVTAYLTVQSPRFNNIDNPGWTDRFRRGDHASVPAMVKAAGGRIWSPQYRGLTPALVKDTQAMGLKVIPWTVNEVADMNRLLDWGVDGIITDHPERLRPLLQQRQLPLAAAVVMP